MNDKNQELLWYVHVNGKNIGPISKLEVLKMIHAGSITAGHLIWRQGQPNWLKASETEFSIYVGSQTKSPQVLNTQSYLDQVDVDEFGGFWARFFANIIDNIVLFVPNTVVSVIFQLTLGPTKGTLISMVFNTAAAFGYFAVLQAKLQGSLGKKVFGLVLVKDNFESLTVQESFRRYMILTMSLMPLGIGAFSVAFDARKRGWHDRYCNSVVIKKSAYDRILQNHNNKVTALGGAIKAPESASSKKAA